MKRIICLLLMLTLLCGVLPAMAAENLVDVRCEEQGFSTKIPADKTAQWDENWGLRISVGKPGYVPYVSIYRRPDNLKNPVNFLNNVYREFMEENYNNNVGTNPCKTVEIGGKQLYLAQYHYEANGNKLCLALAIEARPDGDVEYYAKFAEGKGDEPMDILDTAVRYYHTDDEAAEPEQEKPAEQAGSDLEDVRCDEASFSTKMPAGKSTTYQEDGSLRIWLGDAGYVPNVQIQRRQKKLNNPENYVKNVYTNYMKETYGDRLVGTSLHEYYEAGGKRLLGATYIYKGSSGATINQVHLVEVRDDGDVEYNARFLNDEREATLTALDIAVRYYQPYAEAGAAPAAKQTAKTANPAAATKSTKSIATKKVGDKRYEMKLPEGWQILTSGDYSVFSFKAWDPANPNRTIFFLMKMEPFLKSWAAKETYQKVDKSLGGNSLYSMSAHAPVMESCTLQGVLDAIPQTRDFCDYFYDAGLTLNSSVLPQIQNAKILKKVASNLPAPSTCKENVIAHISFQDYLGQSCEGLVTAQPLDTMSYDFYGVDGWPYTVYLFMGVTAPKGELQELAPTLTECLGSFGFTQSYLNEAIAVSTAEYEAIRAQGEMMQAVHDAMAAAWDAMIRGN